MAYDYERLLANITSNLLTGESITHRMHAVISECEQQRPHQDWELLRRIQYESDIRNIRDWLSFATGHLSPSTAYAGLWFGLCNPVVDGRVTADVYACPSATFLDDSIEWACDAEASTLQSYLSSAVLREIYSIAYRTESGLGNDAEYPLALAYAGMAASDTLAASPIPGMLRSVRGVSVGFDSGDFLALGAIVEGRFVPRHKAV